MTIVSRCAVVQCGIVLAIALGTACAQTPAQMEYERQQREYWRQQEQQRQEQLRQQQLMNENARRQQEQASRINAPGGQGQTPAQGAARGGGTATGAQASSAARAMTGWNGLPTGWMESGQSRSGWRVMSHWIPASRSRSAILVSVLIFPAS